MEKQTFLTTYNPEEFKDLLTECVNDAVKSEVNRILNSPKRSDKAFLTRRETAIELNVSLPTLNAWEKGKILIPVRIGTRVRYKLEDIQDALSKPRKG